MSGKMIDFWKGAPVPYRLAGLNIFTVQNIRELLKIQTE